MRIFFVHHVTWSINSICHFHGRRRFATEDHSTNVWWLSLASLGEAWHHNHHAFPRSAVHGLRRWELDPSGALIGAMQRARPGLERGADHARSARREKLAAEPPYSSHVVRARRIIVRGYAADSIAATASEREQRHIGRAFAP